MLQLLKVFWEPFIEPWQFEINMIRKQEMSLNSSAMTNIHLQSRGHLSLNFTESLIEVFPEMLHSTKSEFSKVHNYR